MVQTDRRSSPWSGDRGLATSEADMSPFVSPSPFKRCCRAKRSGIIVRVSGVGVPPPASRSTAEFRPAELIHAASPPRIRTPTNLYDRLGVSHLCPPPCPPRASFRKLALGRSDGELAQDEHAGCVGRASGSLPRL